MRKERWIGELALFNACRPDELRFVARIADEVEVAEGARVTDGGATVREFIVIVDGVAVTDDGDVLRRDAHLGEIELLGGRRRHRGVVALTPLRALVFDARSFSGLLAQVPSVARKLMRELVDRVAAA